MNGWNGAATSTINLYIRQSQGTDRAARAIILYAYQTAYTADVAEHADRWDCVQNARALGRSRAADALQNWVEREISMRADVQNLPSARCAEVRDYEDMARYIVTDAVTAYLGACDWREIVTAMLDADAEECARAARQIGDCAEVPRSLVWTDHAAHMALNAEFIGYPIAEVRSIAEKIARGVDVPEVTGNHVMDAARRVRANCKRRGLRLPAYYGATCDVDASGYHDTTAYAYVDAAMRDNRANLINGYVPSKSAEVDA